ncbi:MAG: hypothetical protein K8S27_14955 [Candidatus Omnitrophica bacterium]|nr:hypothetical protein [Candidatus Omnitrophota bacterium]
MNFKLTAPKNNDDILFNGYWNNRPVGPSLNHSISSFFDDMIQTKNDNGAYIGGHT